MSPTPNAFATSPPAGPRVPFYRALGSRELEFECTVVNAVFFQNLRRVTSRYKPLIRTATSLLSLPLPLVSTHAPRRLARTSLPSRKRDCQENIVSSVWSCVLPGCDTYVLRLPVGHDVPLQFEESYVRMVAR